RARRRSVPGQQDPTTARRSRPPPHGRAWPSQGGGALQLGPDRGAARRDLPSSPRATRRGGADAPVVRTAEVAAPMIGTLPVSDRAPLDYRYALDAAASLLCGAGPALVLCQAGELRDEVRQRIPRWAAKESAAAALWVEPRA